MDFQTDATITAQRGDRMNWTPDLKRALVILYLMQRGTNGTVNNADYDTFIIPVMNDIVGTWLRNADLEDIRPNQARKQLGDWMLQRTDRPSGWNVVAPPNDLHNATFAADMARVEGIVRAAIVRLGVQVPVVDGAISFLAPAAATAAPNMPQSLIVILPVAMPVTSTSQQASISLPDHNPNNAAARLDVDFSDRILYSKFVLSKRTYADYVIDLLGKNLDPSATAGFFGAVYPSLPTAIVKRAVDQHWLPAGFDFLAIAKLLKQKLAAGQTSAFGICDTFDSPSSPLCTFGIVGKAFGQPLQMFQIKDISVVDGTPTLDINSFATIPTDVQQSTVYEYGGKIHTISLFDASNALGPVTIKIDAMICAKQICQTCNPSAVSLDHSRTSLHGLPFVSSRDLDVCLIDKDGFEVPAFAPQNNGAMMNGARLGDLAKQWVWYWDGVKRLTWVAEE